MDMKQPVEDIQNKIRNKLTPCVVSMDMLGLILDSYFNKDQKTFEKIMDHCSTSNIVECVKSSIEDIIDISKKCDEKINDPNYDVWEEVLKDRKK